MQNNVMTARLQRKFTHLARNVAIGMPMALTILLGAPAKAEITVEMAGVSAAVTGDVTLNKVTGEIGVLVESGMPVYLGDRIITSPNSGMQVLLLDETVFTIGPNSDVAIDEFVYDPATGDGRIVADMARGVMRFVTGKIPLNNPASMDINLPVGSIGIRGTIGLIRSVSTEQANEIIPGSFDTLNPDDANQMVFMAVNQGPGLERNDTTSRPGAFAVTDMNGNSENITGENFGVFVGTNVVTEPARFPAEAATFDFSTNLVRTASNNDNQDGTSGSGSRQTAPSVSQQASVTPGQAQQANAQTGAAMAGTIEVALAQVGATSASKSQSEITSILGNVDSTNNSSSSNSGSSAFTYDGMRQISTGTFTSGTIAVSSGSLSYNFVTAVNFATRQLSITFQNIQDGGAFLTAVSEGEMKTNTVDFSSSTGEVKFSGSDFTPDSGGNCTSGGCNATATFTDAKNVDFKLTTTAVSAGASGSATLN
ncbi:FecR family protein [Thalassospira sp. SM2505]|uniref:FecR family protein n=1 Tax=Thalassospira profundimaris TaxID=502049 RepID=UPI00215DA614|nr:FecR domain-containing protein [Thalassospira profundimaris]